MTRSGVTPGMELVSTRPGASLGVHGRAPPPPDAS